jgi:LDH2 family malate/lactate/ureidoglycolate dehydrogenase
MLIKVEEIRNICIGIFNSIGVNDQLSELIVDDLIDNDIQKYSSHGVMRVKEYVTHIKQGYILCKNKPTVSLISNTISMIDGNKSFGVLVVKKVVKHLLQKLKTNKFGFVTFANSGHIGRLANIAEPIINTGGIIIGFLNFSGSGQNVIPFGGKIPKLCTNPIVMGVPSPEGPILMDFSTSSYSEGKLRDAYYRNQEIPDGVLVDKNGNSITDPKEFYKKYGEVFLTPLGGSKLGYKGFGLSLFTEILAGIVSGGGCCSTKPGGMTNSGFFLTFLPEIFNQSSDTFSSEVNNLINYLREPISEMPSNNVSIPGLRKMNNKQTKSIDLPQKILDELKELKNG